MVDIYIINMKVPVHVLINAMKPKFLFAAIYLTDMAMKFQL